MNAMKAAIVLSVLLLPYALMHVNAQGEFKVDIAEGSQKVDSGKSYMPTRIAVPVGATVVWKNFDDAPHTVTSGTPTCPGLCWGLDFNSGIMRLDDVYRITFDKEGIYHYLCALHPWMTGTVIVGNVQETPLELSVRLDRATYKVGDNVNLEGSVSTLIEGVRLVIDVLNPDKESVVSESISVGSDGAFNYNFKLAGNEFTPGSYTVKVRYSDAGAESNFVVERGTVGADDGNADIRVAAKQIKDLLLIRVRSAEASTANVYGITIGTSDSVIEAFRGPRSWSEASVTASEATSSSDEEPLGPGGKAVFKLKVSSDDFVIVWIAFDSEHNVLDQGEAKPIRR